MSPTALVITISYSIAVVIGSVISFAVWASTNPKQDEAGDARARHARQETVWLFVVLAALFALLMATIFYVPYGTSAGQGKQIVRVTGVQFAWAIDPVEVKVGVPVEFLASATDVNHGFGVYDPDGALIFQAQVVPGQTQKVVWTFEKTGRHEVICLEFCGQKHHEMISSFEVTS